MTADTNQPTEPAPEAPAIATAASAGYTRRIGLGAALQFGGGVIQQLLKFLANLVIAHLMGKADLGIFNLTLTFWNAVQMSFSGGLLRGVLRYLPHYLARSENADGRGTIKLALWSSWIGGGVVALLMYLFAPTIATQVLNRPETAPSLRVLALLMPLSTVATVIWASARALGSLNFIVYQFLIVPGLFVLLILPVALLNGDSSGLAWAYVGSFLLPLLPLWRYHGRLTKRLREFPARIVAGPFLSFAGVAALLWFAEYAARNIDLVIVGRLTSSADAGVYVIASRNATLCHVVLVSINSFFAPTVSGLYSTHRSDELQSLFQRATLWIVIVGAPIIVFTMALAPALMLLFNEDFLPGALPLWVLAVGQLFNVGTGLVATALAMCGRQQSVLLTNLAGIGVTGALCYLLIPEYGLTGAAIAMAASVVLVNLSQSVWAYVKLGLTPLSAAYYKPFIAAGAAALATQLAASHLPGLAAQLIGGLILFTLLYALLMLALGMKEEALAALVAVRSGMNKRNRQPAPEEE